MRVVQFVLLAAAMLGGCATQVATDKGDPAEVTLGKGDGTVEASDLTFGQPVEATIAADAPAHAWRFTLTGPATVSIETSGEEEVDTVLRLQPAEGEELMNDDANGLFSALDAELDAGEHLIVVSGYNADVTGTFSLLATCDGEGCPEGSMEPVDPEEPSEPSDPWAMARDVNAARVTFPANMEWDQRYQNAAGTSPFGLSGPEWWQRWEEGARQSFSYSEGTDYGKRCAQAATIRFEEILKVEGNGLVRLREGSNWGGYFYNWIEDISEDVPGDAHRPMTNSSMIWAWRTGALKWISVVNADGSCMLPTMRTIENTADRCLAQAEREEGEIEGCSGQ